MAATTRHDQLTKPAGALGQLEDIAVRICGITGGCPSGAISNPQVLVFAADHGVVASGVTPWPQEVTALMARNMVEGGAAVSVLARQAGAGIQVFDVGMVSDVSDLEGIGHHKIAPGTADISSDAAMSYDEAIAALTVGAKAATAAVSAGADLIAVGEMGIGNTTASSALVASMLGVGAEYTTGRGTGIDDEMLLAKQKIVTRAVERTAGMSDPVNVLAEIGGFEIAAMAGAMIGAASQRVPVIVDGVIANAALLVASRIRPGIEELVLAGHRSSEPAATLVLKDLGLFPLLDLGLRLGEGSGAVLAIPLVKAAVAVLREMATFADLGIEAS